MILGLRFLVVGYFGYHLVGDDAVLEVVLRDLRSAYPDCRITVSSIDPEATQDELGVEAVQIDSFEAVVRQLHDCDVVVLASAGGLNEYLPVPAVQSIDEKLPYNRLCAEVPLLAQLYGVRCVIFAAGVGHLYSEHAKRMVRNCFDASTARVVRDSSALRLLAGTGANMEGVVVTCDPAWTLSPEPKPAFDVASLGFTVTRPIIGLTLRHWDLVPQRLSQDPQPWEEEVAAALKAFCTETGAQLLFIPNQAAAGYLFADDRAFSERFQKRLAGCRAAIWDRPVTPRNVLMALSVCDISLAMRHHGAIMAAVAGVPGIALAYTEKVRAAWADAGLNNRVVDLADITREGLQAALFAVWRERTTERDLLARIVAERSAQHRITLSMLTDATVSQPRFARETKALADAYLALREVAGSVLTPVARDVLAGALSQTVTVDDLKILKSAFSKLAYIFPREPLYAFLVGYYEVLSTHASDEGIQALIRAEECGYAIEWCRYWRARLYLLLGNVQAARDCLVEALVANPVFSEASDLLSQLKA